MKLLYRWTVFDSVRSQKLLKSPAVKSLVTSICSMISSMVTGCYLCKTAQGKEHEKALCVPIVLFVLVNLRICEPSARKGRWFSLGRILLWTRNKLTTYNCLGRSSGCRCIDADRVVQSKSRSGLIVGCGRICGELISRLLRYARSVCLHTSPILAGSGRLPVFIPCILLFLAFVVDHTHTLMLTNQCNIEARRQTARLILHTSVFM